MGRKKEREIDTNGHPEREGRREGKEEYREHIRKEGEGGLDKF